ncbi:MAG: hypothetical protein Q8O98_00750 [bacterium]|nr:hypothetical protein [bacterium]
MTNSSIRLPSKEELKRRLTQLIPAPEIERERGFYLHGLMFFTEEEQGEIDVEGLWMFLMMTMGANVGNQTRPIDIESVVDAIVGDTKTAGDVLKARFQDIAERYRRTK